MVLQRASRFELMTKAMAMVIDHGPSGIRVNCICPGDTDTPMLPDDARQRGTSWESYLKGANNLPTGRIGTAEEDLLRTPDPNVSSTTSTA